MIYIKEDGLEIELNDEPATKAKADELGWKPKKEAKPKKEDK